MKPSLLHSLFALIMAGTTGAAVANDTSTAQGNDTNNPSARRASSSAYGSPANGSATTQRDREANRDCDRFDRRRANGDCDSSDSGTHTSAAGSSALAGMGGGGAMISAPAPGARK